MFDFVSFIPRAVAQGIPLLYGSTGETLTEKSGNLNLGLPGVMYVGAISGVIGSFMYEQSTPAAEMSGVLAVGIPLVCCLVGSLLMGLLYCFLTVTLRANQNVTGLALTTFGVGFGNFFGGSLIKLTDSDVPSIALSATSGYFKASLPFASELGWFGKLFLSYGMLAYIAIVLALCASYFLNRTRPGLNLRAVGESPATADAAGINVTRYKYGATCVGSMIAGLGGLSVAVGKRGHAAPVDVVPDKDEVYPIGLGVPRDSSRQEEIHLAQVAQESEIVAMEVAYGEDRPLPIVYRRAPVAAIKQISLRPHIQRGSCVLANFYRIHKCYLLGPRRRPSCSI